MRIVFLTQYFPPEVGAPQNRIYHLARRLQQKGAKITVLTAMPNYPDMVIHEDYRGKLYRREKMDNMTILRSWIFVRNSRKNLLFRLLTYFSFVITSLLVGIVKLRKHDILFCESPPLFLGITGYLLRLIKGGRLIMNISDLWPASAEATGLIRNRFLLGTAEKLESFLYRRSDQVCGQTQGIVDHIDAKMSDGKTYLLRNGVDLDYYSANNAVTGWRRSAGFAEEDFVLLYAGIIGYFQGLEVIIKAAARLMDHNNIRFVLVGSGPVKEQLMELRDKLGASNVSFFDTVPKRDMPSIISDCDAGIIPLKDIELFRGAVPSKAFEYLALKKPILLGVRGEARDLLIDKGKCGLAFEPEDDQDLSKQILELLKSANLRATLGENGHRCVSENFNRNEIADAFWKNLIEASKRKSRF